MCRKYYAMLDRARPKDVDKISAFSRKYWKELQECNRYLIKKHEETARRVGPHAGEAYELPRTIRLVIR